MTYKFTKGDKDRRSMYIVCEQVYRFYGERSRDKNDREALKQAAFFRCLIGPETNKHNIIDFSETIGWKSLLARCPIDAKRNISPGAKAKYPYGVYVTSHMKPGLITLAAETLMSVVDFEEVIVDDTSEDREIWFCDNIPSEFLLNELIHYNKTGNFDSVSAFFVLCLYISQRIIDGGIKHKHLSDDNQYKRLINVFKNDAKRVIRKRNSAYDGW